MRCSQLVESILRFIAEEGDCEIGVDVFGNEIVQLPENCLVLAHAGYPDGTQARLAVIDLTKGN